MGLKSVRLVLVDSLDMGHDSHSPAIGVDFFGRAADGTVAGMERMDMVRRVMGTGSAGESCDAVVSAVLWTVDLVE